MRSIRFAINIALLLLPVVLVLLVGAYFWWKELPELVNQEKENLRLAYRMVALDVRDNRQNFAKAKRTSKWKIAGKMNPGRWGYVEDTHAGQAIVWYGKDDNVSYVRTALHQPRDHEAMFWWVAALVFFIVLGATVLCIKYFVDYIRTRDDFIAATAHDLTTPLVGLRYALQFGRDDAPLIVERMIRLVNNLKDFLRLGGRNPKPNFENFDVVEAFASAYLLFAADYEEEESGPVKRTGLTELAVYADRLLVEQILWNLLGNELKYAAPYGAVSVNFSVDGDFAVVEFSDLGPGMTSKEMRKAFNRYYRAKTVMVSGKGGFGIGLCASKEAAQRMNGSLGVKANTPNGCIFTLKLPLKEKL